MTDKPSAPGYSIGTSKKAQFANLNGVPGPGAYTDQQARHEKCDKKIARQLRFSSYETLAPGPGTYSNFQKLQHVPTASIKSRLKQMKTQDNPGPGAYQSNPIRFMKSQSTYKIGQDKQRKEDIPKSILNNPGPGNYETDKSTLLQKQMKAIKFGPQRKIVLDIDKKTPGPGQYNQTGYINNSSITSQPKYQFGKSQRSKSTTNLAPGPGMYDSKGMFDDALKRGKGFSIGEKSPKNDSLGVKLGPGPGQYNDIGLAKMKKSTPSFSIGKNAKLQLDNIREFLSKPGPQTYESRVSGLNNQTYSIGKEKRKGMESKNNVPGPGEYQIKKNQNQPLFSISKGNRSNLVDKRGNPGPADYQPKPSYNTEYNNIGLGKDKRRTFDVKQIIPGPGDYNSIQSTSKGGYTIGHDKRSHESKVIGPGPGNYSLPTTVSNLPSYSRKK